jgi:hypothetical protein
MNPLRILRDGFQRARGFGADALSLATVVAHLATSELADLTQALSSVTDALHALLDDACAPSDACDAVLPPAAHELALRRALCGSGGKGGLAASAAQLHAGAERALRENAALRAALDALGVPSHAASLIADTLAACVAVVVALAARDAPLLPALAQLPGALRALHLRLPPRAHEAARDAREALAAIASLAGALRETVARRAEPAAAVALAPAAVAALGGALQRACAPAGELALLLVGAHDDGAPPAAALPFIAALANALEATQCAPPCAPPCAGGGGAAAAARCAGCAALEALCTAQHAAVARLRALPRDLLPLCAPAASPAPGGGDAADAPTPPCAPLAEEAPAGAPPAPPPTQAEAYLALVALRRRLGDLLCALSAVGLGLQLLRPALTGAADGGVRGLLHAEALLREARGAPQLARGTVRGAVARALTHAAGVFRCGDAALAAAAEGAGVLQALAPGAALAAIAALGAARKRALAPLLLDADAAPSGLARALFHADGTLCALLQLCGEAAVDCCAAAPRLLAAALAVRPAKGGTAALRAALAGDAPGQGAICGALFSAGAIVRGLDTLLEDVARAGEAEAHGGGWGVSVGALARGARGVPVPFGAAAAFGDGGADLPATLRTAAADACFFVESAADAVGSGAARAAAARAAAAAAGALALLPALLALLVAAVAALWADAPAADAAGEAAAAAAGGRGAWWLRGGAAAAAAAARGGRVVALAAPLGVAAALAGLVAGAVHNLVCLVESDGNALSFGARAGAVVAAGAAAAALGAAAERGTAAQEVAAAGAALLATSALLVWAVWSLIARLGGPLASLGGVANALQMFSNAQKTLKKLPTA